MRLTKIEVTKLFGVFDHTIELNQSDRITIIHGPNGYGKTAILQMVRALLGGNFTRLRRTPFSSFAVELDDGRRLSITKIAPQKPEKRREDRSPLSFELRDAAGKHGPYVHESPNPRELGYPIELLERHVPDLDRVGPETWIQTSTGKLLDSDEVIELYADFLPHRGREKKPLPEWLSGISKQFDVRLIEAQRLLSVPDRPRANRPATGLEPSVSSYSKELAGSIQAIQAKYGTSSQQLDSTFPNRVIQTTAPIPIAVEDLKNRLRDLGQKRQRIIAAGLLTAEQDYTPIFDPHRAIDASTQNILALYSQDVEKKLSVFTEVTERIELFKELINKRFSYKQLDIEAQTGFRLRAASGGALLPSDLSSGEQHELVLLYELLFKTRPNALIMVDEPELSLHVAWQVEFLRDLARIIKLSSFDALLATHSPQIINDRWDLTTELKGPSS